jgi:hypothetical protein
MKKLAGLTGLVGILLFAACAHAGFTETVPKGTFIIDSSFLIADVTGAWDNEGNLGPIIQPDQRYEPTTGELLGTLAPQVEASQQIWANVIQYGIVDSLTAVVGIPLFIKSTVNPNFQWTPGDIIAQYGRRFETIDDFWAYASGYGQPEVTDWEGNYAVLSDIVLGGRYRFTDWFSWCIEHGLAGALTVYGAVPTGREPDPEEVVSVGTATWNLHFQGDIGFHLGADKKFGSLDDRLTLGVDGFYEMFLKHEYDTPTGTIHRILLIDQDKEAGTTYTIDPGDFYGISFQADFVPWKGPAVATWLSSRDVEKAEKFPPLLTLTFRYTYTRFGQTDWESNSALWDWDDKEEVWGPGYKNILTGLVTVSLLRVGVPLQLYGGYRNQTWIPGKNFRAANVITSGFRLPLKFW